MNICPRAIRTSGWSVSSGVHRAAKALPEKGPRTVPNPTRSELLRTVPVAALFAGGLVAAFQTVAVAATPGDIAILNSAIALERAGIKAYRDGAASGLLQPAVLEVAKGFMSDHMAHRDALIAAVKAAGATPTDATAQLTYPSLKSQADVLAFAESVEKQAASAYLAAFGQLSDRNLARAAASILGVETMHAGILAAALGQGAPYHGFIS